MTAPPDLIDRFADRKGLARTPQYTEYAATWWGQNPGGNWYWRAEVPARHLLGQVLQLRYSDVIQRRLAGEDEFRTYMPRQQGDTAIWCYPGNTTRGILMAAQRAAGYRVLVEVDDNYTIDSPAIPRKNTSWSPRRPDGEQIGHDTHNFQTHKHLAKIADGVIVTTETLAKPYRELNDNVYVCRNSVDPDDWPEPDKPDDGIFRVGYAASHSHWWDIADVQRALSEAAYTPGVEVLIYGIDANPPYPHRQVPWTTDLAKYRASLAQLDVGVCPLRPGPWANCKSDIKVLELSMAGAAAIVSRTFPYEEWWGDEWLVADTPKDFLKQMRWCLKNRDGVRENAQRAKERILVERTIQTEIGRWREAVA